MASWVPESDSQEKAVESGEAAGLTENSGSNNSKEMEEVNMKNDEELQGPLKDWAEIEKENQVEIFKRYHVKPKKTWMHRAFELLSYGTCVAAVFMVGGQMFSMIYYDMSATNMVLACYIVALCITVILNELERTQLIRESAILNYWITRGLFYSFIGVLGIEQDEVENEKTMMGFGQDVVSTIFVDVASYVMLGFGLLYYACGCLCLQIVRNGCVKDYEKRTQELNETKADTKK